MIHRSGWRCERSFHKPPRRCPLWLSFESRTPPVYLREEPGGTASHPATFLRIRYTPGIPAVFQGAIPRSSNSVTQHSVPHLLQEALLTSLAASRFAEVGAPCLPLNRDSEERADKKREREREREREQRGGATNMTVTVTLVTSEMSCNTAPLHSLHLLWLAYSVFTLCSLLLTFHFSLCTFQLFMSFEQTSSCPSADTVMTLWHESFIASRRRELGDLLVLHGQLRMN